jgi:MerR family transcriptional regulator, light-induced transcriptional regulator
MQLNGGGGLNGGQPKAGHLSTEGLAAGRILKERREKIAERVTDLYFAARPQLEQYGKGARQKCTEDNLYHIDYLGEALSFGRPALFTDYAVWVAALLAPLKIPGDALALNLELLQTVLATELEGAGGALAGQYLDAALALINAPPPVIEGLLQGTGVLDVLARDYLAALLEGKRDNAGRLVIAAADGGIPVKDLYLQVFQRVQHEVGRLWQSNQIGVAQEHYCTACTQLVMSQFYPRIFSAPRNGSRLVATCVSGDLHELGLRMVTDFFEMDGWDTFYLGANTPISGTLRQLMEREPQVLAVSATLSFHVQAVADLITAVRATGRAPHILVGGAPFNAQPGLWQDVGADACGRDAMEATSLAAGWRA